MKTLFIIYVYLFVIYCAMAITTVLYDYLRYGIKPLPSRVGKCDIAVIAVMSIIPIVGIICLSYVGYRNYIDHQGVQHDQY